MEVELAESTINPLKTQNSDGTVSSSLKSDVESADTLVLRSSLAAITTDIQFSCLREFIVKHHDIYRLTCFTGILKPSKNENTTRSLSRYNIRWRMWNNYLHIGLAVGTLAFVYLGTDIFITTTSSGGTLKFCEFYGVVLQHFLLYPAVIYLRNEIELRRDINEAVYLEAFHYASKKVRLVFMSLLTFSIIFYGLDASRNRVGRGFAVFLIYVTILTPALFFLCGLLTFLIVEQRVSYQTMEGVSAEVQNHTLTLEKYFTARESIDCRDRVTPINLLIFAAIINTLIGIILVFALAGESKSTLLVLFDIVYVMSNFGRQTVILILILWEIIRVNDVAEHIIKALSRRRWPGRDLEEERVSVFMAAKEHPIGSTIFYYRPTKFEMMVQIASACIGVVTAVFWALLFA